MSRTVTPESGLPGSGAPDTPDTGGTDAGAPVARSTPDSGPAADRSAGSGPAPLPLDQDAHVLAVGSAWAVGVRSLAFLRKELMEILRQPKLILLLVAGPFALLMLFGFGYGETTIEKRAIFVGQPGSVYDEVLADYEQELNGFIESAGMVPTIAEGRAALRDGDVDVVVVFPDDPLSSVLSGERAVIEVLHDEIDPLQESAIRIASRVAIQDANATVLATITSEFQGEFVDAEEVQVALREFGELQAADAVAARDELRPALDALAASMDGSRTIIDRLAVDDTEQVGELDRTRAHLADLVVQLDEMDGSMSDAEFEALAVSAEELADEIDEIVVLDPDVLVRPFDSATDNVLDEVISSNDYFTPGSLALLLQHLAVTFAALSLVRDRRTGLFELLRVGPLSSVEIVVGKLVAYLLVGSVVAIALVTASVGFLGVPIVGSVAWLAVSIATVLVASIALGMVLAILSGTESQAVQYAMLTLLGGLFFSGFALPIEGLDYPVRYVSWLLPVTYGIDALQDVMLRGRDPDPSTLLGLVALVVVYGGLATAGLTRQLRNEDA